MDKPRSKDPIIAHMYLELAEQHGLPKKEAVKEYEDLLDLIVESGQQYFEEDEKGISSYEAATLDEILEKAKGVGVSKDKLNSAATILLDAYLNQDEDIWNSNILQDLQEKYSLTDEQIRKSILRRYHEKFDVHGEEHSSISEGTQDITDETYPRINQEDTSTNDLRSQVGQLIQYTGKKVAGLIELVRKNTQDPPSVHRSDQEILYTLEQSKKPISLKELEFQTSISYTYLSKKVKELRDEGMVKEVKKQGQDRRFSFFEITEEGIKTIEKIDILKKESIEQILSNLNNEELDLIIRATKILNVACDKAIGAFIAKRGL